MQPILNACVYIVDDDASVRDAMAWLLRSRHVLSESFESAEAFSLMLKNQFPDATTSFAKVNEVSPKYVSGYFWRARANAQLDSTSEAGLAKPFYEKYVELAAVDSASTVKYNAGLVEAYTYLASYQFLIAKDNAATLDYLRKKALLNLDPEELKRVQLNIKQLDGSK